MKKWGFTLVELLAVLVLIAAISLFVFPSIINYINSLKGDINETTKQLILDSAEVYVANNETLFPQTLNSSRCFVLQELIDEDYLETSTLNNQAGNIDPTEKYIQADYVYNNELGIEKYNLRLLDRCIDYGDITLDGIVDSSDFDILKAYIKGEISEEQLEIEALLNADVNADGVVDAYDLTVLLYNTISEPLIASLPYSINTSNFIYGDLNFDGVVNNDDTTIFSSIIDGSLVATDIQKMIADVNVDGVVDGIDSGIIFEYFEGEIEKLPLI